MTGPKTPWWGPPVVLATAALMWLGESAVVRAIAARLWRMRRWF